MRWVVALLLICAVIGSVWYQSQTRVAARDDVAIATGPAAVGSAPSSERDAQGAIASVPVVADEVRTQEERLAFHARTRRFFAQAPAMNATDRTREAQSIAGEVSVYERRGELSAGEALLLKSALIREAVADPSEQSRQVAELERSYRTETQQRREAWAAQRDPMFELYKLREDAIVANVMAMQEIPDGLSRNEYLRRTLQQERELLLEQPSQ
jgi:hypothetical protein